MLVLILLIAATICLLMAAFGFHFRRVHLGWLGMALFAITLVIPRI